MAAKKNKKQEQDDAKRQHIYEIIRQAQIEQKTTEGIQLALEDNDIELSLSQVYRYIADYEKLIHSRLCAIGEGEFGSQYLNCIDALRKIEKDINEKIENFEGEPHAQIAAYKLLKDLQVTKIEFYSNQKGISEVQKALDEKYGITPKTINQVGNIKSIG